MPPRNAHPGAKPEQTFGTLKRIFSYMYGFKVQLILVVIWNCFKRRSRNCRKLSPQAAY